MVTALLVWASFTTYLYVAGWVSTVEERDGDGFSAVHCLCASAWPVFLPVLLGRRYALRRRARRALLNELVASARVVTGTRYLADRESRKY